MVSLASVEDQLKRVGCNFRFWGRSELKELCHILIEDETIASAINGEYEGGFALLCATDRRVLLVDKKPRFLTLKDIRFEMITEMDYNHRILNATVRLFTASKELHFTAYNQRRLRQLFHYVQQKVVETRANHMLQQQFQQNQLLAAGMMAQNSYMQLPSGQPQQNAVTNDITFVPNQAQSRLASFMGKMGVHGGSSNETSVTAAYSDTPAFRGWRRRIAPYRY